MQDEVLAHISPVNSENVDFFGVIDVDVEGEPAKLDGDGFRRFAGSSPSSRVRDVVLGQPGEPEHGERTYSISPDLRCFFDRAGTRGRVLGFRRPPVRIAQASSSGHPGAGSRVHGSHTAAGAARG